MNEWTQQEWAQRVRALGAEARARRIQAVNVLLDQPDDLSTPLESELHILLGELQPETEPGGLYV